MPCVYVVNPLSVDETLDARDVCIGVVGVVVRI